MKRSFRIVWVEPEYEINLGYIARTMKNFGFGELWLIRPKARIGRIAKMYAKHGYDVLEGARVVDDLYDALKDCDFIIGTTAVRKRSRETLRNPFSLKQFIRRIGSRSGRFAILLGRDGTGLNNAEVKICDMLVSIPTNPSYSALNISHALAIILYELSSLRKRKPYIESARKEMKEQLEKEFSEMVEMYGDKLRNKEKVKLAFRRILGRAVVSKVENSALLGVIHRAKEDLKKLMRG